MPFSRGLMTLRQLQMMPVASGQLYQGVNEIKTGCDANTICISAWSDASRFAAHGAAPPQQDPQQMELQHQQHSGFYGWGVPDPTGS
jgi:hypothetical protein